MNVIRLTGSDGGPGLECVVGLQWDQISKVEWKKQKKQAKTNDIAFVEVPVTTGDSRTVNVGTARCSDLPEKGGISLAGWIAHAFKTGAIIAVEEVTLTNGEQAFWFCAVNNGQVVTDTDIIGDWDDIDTHVSVIADMLASSGDVGYLGADTGKLSANTSGEATPTKLASSIPKSTQKKAEIKIPGKVDKRLVIGGAVAVLSVVIVAGTWVGLNVIASSDSTEDLRQKRMMQIQKAKRDYNELIAETKSKVSAEEKLSFIIGTKIGHLETKLGGWHLTGGECGTTECSFSFANEDLTDPSVVIQGTANVCDKVSVNMEGIEANCIVEIDALSQEKKQNRIAFLIKEDVLKFRSDLMAYAKYYDRASYAIGDATDVQFSGKRLLSDTPLFKQGTWALSIPVSQVPDAIDMLGKHNGLSLGNIELDWNAKTVDIAGTYYEKGES